ncbi:MAG: indole-3-glycerol phosphate synthase TrpC [Steroidobacteraceae bacterium]
MSGFLTQVSAASHRRARAAVGKEPLARLRMRALNTAPAPALLCGHAFELIAEYKRRSPAAGSLSFSGDSLAGRVSAYARGGAAAVSILTEPEHFGGSLEQLAEAAAILAPLGLPVLRKDFLVDPYQLHEARAAGAGGVLLIVRLLSDAQLEEMLDCARQLQMFVLLEAFDADDAGRAVATATVARERKVPALVGVNSRDLQTLEVVPGRLAELAPLLPPELPRVAESGIATPQDCGVVAGAGYCVALVGGSLMKSADPAGMVRAMLAAGRASAKVAA